MTMHAAGTPQVQLPVSEQKLAGTGLRLNVRVLAVALFVGAAAIALRGVLLLRFPFDGLYGQDAYFYLIATRGLVEVWTDPQKLWQWLTIAGTSPISVWPLGYHLQIALAANLVGLGAASGQIISLLTGVLTPVWTALLVVSTWRLSHKDEQDARSIPVIAGALLAGLLVTFSALAVRSSVVVMADMASVHWATLGALLATLYGREPAGRTGLGWLSGLCLGIASITRYIYPLVLLPAAGFVILARRERLDSPSGRSGWGPGMRRALPIVLPAVVLVGLQFLHNSVHPQSSLPSPVIATWNPMHALQTTFDGPDGRLSYDSPIAYFYFVRPLLSPSALGLSFLAFFALGLFHLAQRRAMAVLCLLAGWWLLFALFYSGTIYQPDRFILSYLPPMDVLAGLGFAWLVTLLLPHLRAPRSSRGRFRIAGLVAVLALGLVITGFAVSTRAAVADYRQLYDGKEDYMRATRCLQAAIAGQRELPPVYSFSVTFTLSQYTDLKPRELYFETPASIDATLGTDQARPLGYLLLPLNRFEEQWGHTAMGTAYHHLRDDYTLKQIDCPGTSFSLFEIISR